VSCHVDKESQCRRFVVIQICIRAPGDEMRVFIFIFFEGLRSCFRLGIRWDSKCCWFVISMLRLEGGARRGGTMPDRRLHSSC